MFEEKKKGRDFTVISVIASYAPVHDAMTLMTLFSVPLLFF